MQPVEQPVECLYKQYNRLSNRLPKRFDIRFDNRLYCVNVRVNGVSELARHHGGKTASIDTSLSSYCMCSIIVGLFQSVD